MQAKSLSIALLVGLLAGSACLLEVAPAIAAEPDDTGYLDRALKQEACDEEGTDSSECDAAEAQDFDVPMDAEPAADDPKEDYPWDERPWWTWHVTEHITFIPGLRLQPRYTFETGSDNNDIFLRRFRAKAKGTAYDLVKYYAELKVDSTGKTGSDPKAAVENGWVDFRAWKPADLNFRIGLYDLPFSRVALTSDSKLLFMDRGILKDTLSSFGLADNTIGLLAHGRPFGGHFTYAFGIFDNQAFERIGASGTRSSKRFMPAVRLGVDLLDPAKEGGYADYRGSYIGQGQRLNIGANTAYLGNAKEGDSSFALLAWGIDLFYNSGPYTFQAEYDYFRQDMIGPDPDIPTDGWYVQGGYLLEPERLERVFDVPSWFPPLEFAGRYQDLDPDKNTAANTLRYASVGMNIYIRQHNLKVQTDYTFKTEDAADIDNDLFQVQLQLDF